MANRDLYKKLLTVNGDTQRERDIKEFRNHIALNYANMVDFKTVLINGVESKLLVTDKSNNVTNFNKKQIIPLLDTIMHIGDIVTYQGNNYIITNGDFNTEIYTRGVMELCNVDLNFQIDTVTYIQPCLMNKSFAETEDDGKTINVSTGKTVLMLPYNDTTKKIFKGQRFMIDTCYDENGDKIGVCYKVTGYDTSYKNYGDNGKLLILTIETDIYNNVNDNIEKMLCDYVEEKPILPNEMSCNINGNQTIPYGLYQTFIAEFYQDETQLDNIVPIWTIDNKEISKDKITITYPQSNKITISIANENDLYGKEFTLTLSEESGLYKECNLDIKVVSMFG